MFSDCNIYISYEEENNRKNIRIERKNSDSVLLCVCVLMVWQCVIITHTLSKYGIVHHPKCKQSRFDEYVLNQFNFIQKWARFTYFFLAYCCCSTLIAIVCTVKFRQ